MNTNYLVSQEFIFNVNLNCLKIHNSERLTPKRYVRMFRGKKYAEITDEKSVALNDARCMLIIQRQDVRM